MIVPSIKDLVQFSPERFKGVTLVSTPHSKTMVVGLEAGQAIPVHHPKSDLTMIVLEGQATLVGGDKDLEKAGPGATLIVEAGQARGIHADERTKVLVVVSPPPTEEDHQELAVHFKKGTWR
jgi:quercetin dioxygenase-like cupin family protein